MINTLNVDTLDVSKQYEPLLQKALSTRETISAITRFVSENYSDLESYIKFRCTYPLVISLEVPRFIDYLSYDDFQTYLLDFSYASKETVYGTLIDPTNYTNRLENDFDLLCRFDTLCSSLGDHLLNSLDIITLEQESLNR